MHEWIKPALGIVAVVVIPVMGVLGMQNLLSQDHSVSVDVKPHPITGACNCGCCQQLNVHDAKEFVS